MGFRPSPPPEVRRRDLIGAWQAPSEDCPPAVRLEGNDQSKGQPDDRDRNGPPQDAPTPAAAVDAGPASSRRADRRGDAAGFARLLAWGRGLDPERVWAIEDCRHVSGRLERSCSPRGEVVRVPPKLMGAAAASAPRQVRPDRRPGGGPGRAARGPRDPARGPPRRAALQLKRLLDHREDLVKARSETSSACAGTCTTSGPTWRSPPAALDRLVWLDRLARKLSRAEQGTRARIARELVARSAAAPAGRRARSARSARWSELAPELLALPGCGALTAAQLLGEIGRRRALRQRGRVRPPGRRRPAPGLLGQDASATASTAAATATSTAPCTASPSPRGASTRRPASYLARKQAEGKTRRGAALPQAPPRPPGLAAFDQI